ncbi:NADPH-dependent F420 reductase [Chryseolinea lacunae]|uniref:Prephenate dehydrogenase/arogenate dehydrogenase family protein n=1 Tax=Chryseolinea lacunae TaxID=2801331 RepID=A0ABS1KKJ0_9BACT|nr:prephenate dehydrogenase/arogenate dehydrogenase family protein [Chryseolinea lacunae]MBL0739976.1 prephenate dehydrogenase/arogenate dehydrogenase family protein [Chryseolinea lacunae]
MKIGIIGTGAIGGTLAKKLAAAGHDVKVTNASAEHELANTAARLGVAHASLRQVVSGVDVVIVSIPTNAIAELPKDLFSGVPDNVIVVDTSNHYPTRDGEMNVFNEKLESVWVSEQLGRPVIKAFNNLLAHSLEHSGKAKGEPERVAMAISGDDEKARRVISTLVDDAGFDPVDNGSLSESWRHQPGMPGYCTELNASELKQALVDKDGIKGKGASLRDKSMEIFTGLTATPTHEEILTILRSLFPTNPKQHNAILEKADSAS